MKYLCDPHVLPTNTCPPDSAELAERSAQFLEFATDVQLDIADGIFAPVVSWPYGAGQLADLEKGPLVQLPYADRLTYEVHMMVQNPGKVGELLARMGAKRLLPHIETLPDADAARAIFASWRAAGAHEIGLSILIDTPLETLDELISEVDVVQMMSIAKIGAQGEPFDDRALQRVEELHAKYPDLLVAVDGGITEGNIEMLVRAGANRLCVGSAISKAASPAKSYAALYDRAMQGCAPIKAEAMA